MNFMKMQLQNSNQPRKILFLDIDGVLNSYAVNYGRKDWPECCYDPSLCRNLKQVLDETGAEIVVSSTWREETYLLDRFPIIFENWGIGHVPVGITTTDNLCFPRKMSDYTWHERNRAMQIQQWVNQHKPAAWIAVDDLALPLPKEHFVRTNRNRGLIIHKAKEAIDKLQVQ